MKKQKDLIWEEDWDYMFIMDACRYDTFEEHIYPKMDERSGWSLECVISAGHNTPEWINNTFDRKMENGVYISGNVHINSLKEITLDLTKYPINKKFTCDARDKFKKIVDVWDWGFHEPSGMIHPLIVADATLEMRHVEDVKVISHFQQPHGPYKSLAEEMDWKRNDSHYPQRVVEKYGEEIFKKVYIHNLFYGMQDVMALCILLRDKKIIITSDHGELLGENGIYGHTYWKEGKKSGEVLLNVPWCVKERGAL